MSLKTDNKTDLYVQINNSQSLDQNYISLVQVKRKLCLY